MLNVGMTEILCFVVIAILILGPDKLPEAARFAGRWYARFKKYIHNIQNEIDQEFKISDFRKEMQDELNRLEALERKVQQQLKELEQKKYLEFEQVSTLLRTKQEKVRVYSFITTAVYIPYKAWRPAVSEQDKNISLSSHTFSPTQLKIAV